MASNATSFNASTLPEGVIPDSVSSELGGNSTNWNTNSSFANDDSVDSDGAIIGSASDGGNVTNSTNSNTNSTLPNVDSNTINNNTSTISTEEPTSFPTIGPTTLLVVSEPTSKPTLEVISSTTSPVVQSWNATNAGNATQFLPSLSPSVFEEYIDEGQCFTVCPNNASDYVATLAPVAVSREDAVKLTFLTSTLGMCVDFFEMLCVLSAFTFFSHHTLSITCRRVHFFVSLSHFDVRL
jgi:hypothetical protein